MDRRPGPGEGVGAPGEVEVVVGLARVEARPARRDQSRGAEQPQVVGHQALRRPQSRDELADPLVGCRELADQPPPQRLGEQPDGRGDR